MSNQDQVYKIIKEIETTQAELANKTDTAQTQHLRAYLDHMFERLTQLTHEHSIQEHNNGDREL